MINYDLWIKEIMGKIMNCFGSRVHFVGIQGSYRRGEATEQSDIDLVFILDSLGMEDLAEYRAIVQSMPHAEKACGFVSGRAELLAWPKLDLFQFYHDTQPIYGSLNELLPFITRRDIRQSVSVQAANLYHAACHSYLFEDALQNLKGLYKSASFLLHAKVFLETGRYFDKKDALSTHLTGIDARILEKNRCNCFSPSSLEADYRLLIEWASSLIAEEK